MIRRQLPLLLNYARRCKVSTGLPRIIRSPWRLFRTARRAGEGAPREYENDKLTTID